MSSSVFEAVQLSRVIHSPTGELSLLHEIGFRLDQGQVMAVIGPSGAGKSTLLRLLNRLDEPSAGKVLLNGEDFRGLDPRALRRRVGMVMQRPFLFPGTVARNIAYGPAQHGISFSIARIAALLEHVGLAGYADRDVATLSGGEAQRISIARALANEPEVLLLDEPTSALDPEARHGIERLLATLVRERRATCVWVTHDLAQAARVADLVLKIEAGKAVAYGTPRELLHA